MAKAKEIKSTEPEEEVVQETATEVAEGVQVEPEAGTEEVAEVELELSVYDKKEKATDPDPIGTIVSRLSYSTSVFLNNKRVSVFPHGRITGVRKSEVSGLVKGVKFIISK